MWVPFAILLGLFSLMVGGLVGHKVGQNECQMQGSVTIERTPPAAADIESQK